VTRESALPTIQSVNVRLSISASTIFRFLVMTNPWTRRRPLGFSLAHSFRGVFLAEMPHLRFFLKSLVQYPDLECIVSPMLGYAIPADDLFN